MFPWIGNSGAELVCSGRHFAGVKLVTRLIIFKRIELQNWNASVWFVLINKLEQQQSNEDISLQQFVAAAFIFTQEQRQFVSKYKLTA